MSKPDVAIAEAAGHAVRAIAPSPTREPYFPGVSFDMVVSIQSFYYLNDDDLALCLESLYEQMKPGAILYATMVGTKCWLYDHSQPAEKGLRVVHFRNDRLHVEDYYIGFTESREHLLQKFHLFEPRQVGYYDALWMEDEGSEFHYTFIGQKV